jgi:hypothetical protein
VKADGFQWARIPPGQSIKTTEVGGEEQGYDAGRKVAGRKRPVAIDTLELVLIVVVHAGYWQD